MKITKSQLREIIREELQNLYEERDYKKEYEEYHSKPEQKRRRAGRNNARRKMERLGYVKKGDGKDVHHRNGNTWDNSTKNITAISKSKNRSMNDK
jgi:hypothetical protein